MFVFSLDLRSFKIRKKKKYFTNKDPDNLSMSGNYNDNGDGLTEWYQSTPGVECYVGDKALKIDREAKTVISGSGRVGCFLLFLFGK